MRHSVDIQIIVGFGYTHLFKENIRHIRIKMLSRVNDNFLYIRETADGSTDHGCFYELRACAYDSNYFHVVNYDFLFP